MARKGAAAALVAIALAFSAGCAHGPNPPPSAGGPSVPGQDRVALTERKCGLCHPASWGPYGTATREDWTKLVERMRTFRRGWISAEEAGAIVEYRSARPAGR